MTKTQIRLIRDRADRAANSSLVAQCDLAECCIGIDGTPLPRELGRPEWWAAYDAVASTDGLTDFELSTLGIWTDSSGRRLTASYHDASTVRVDRSDKTTDVYTWREWMVVYDNIRDAGFRRAA